MKNNVVKGSLCCAGCVINVGFSYLMTNLAGLLCVPLVTKLGCAYTDIAMIWTTLSLGAVIARAFQGQLYDKFNPKTVTLLGAFSYIFGLCGLAFVKTPMQAVLLYVLVGMSNSFCGSLPFALLGSKWIGVGRGTIVGLTGAFAGIITIFISPLAAKMVNIAGFETVAIASGLILGGLHVVSTLLFVCRPPEAYGMSPIDIHFLAPKNNKNSAETAVYETRMPIKELFKLPVFWIVLVLPAFIAIAQSGFYSNRSGIWTEMGLSLEQIGTLGGVFTLCNAIFVWVLASSAIRSVSAKRFWALLFSVSLSMPCILSMPDLATPQPLLWQSSLTLARSMPISGPMLCCLSLARTSPMLPSAGLP